jgi:hypothetical protein
MRDDREGVANTASSSVAPYKLDRNTMTMEMRPPQEKSDSVPIARIAIPGVSRASASVVGSDLTRPTGA